MEMCIKRREFIIEKQLHVHCTSKKLLVECPSIDDTKLICFIHFIHRYVLFVCTMYINCESEERLFFYQGRKYQKRFCYTYLKSVDALIVFVEG